MISPGPASSFSDLVASISGGSTRAARPWLHAIMESSSGRPAAPTTSTVSCPSRPMRRGGLEEGAGQDEYGGQREDGRAEAIHDEVDAPARGRRHGSEDEKHHG